MLQKRNRKTYTYTVEFLEHILNLEGTEHITSVEFDGSRNIVKFNTTRLCINEDVKPTPEASQAPSMVLYDHGGDYTKTYNGDFHNYDCRIAGGWPHSASAHFQEASPSPKQACVCTIPSYLPHPKCCTCVQDDSRTFPKCPTHGFKYQLPQPAEPAMDLLVDFVTQKPRKKAPKIPTRSHKKKWFGKNDR